MSHDEETDFLPALRGRVDADLGLPEMPDLDSLASAEPVPLSPEFVERTLRTVRQEHARSRRKVTVSRLRVAALITVMIAVIVAGTNYAPKLWDGRNTTWTLDFETAVVVVGKAGADDNRRNNALFKVYMVVQEALADLRTTRGDCPEPLRAAIDNSLTLLRGSIEHGLQEPLPGGLPVVQLPPVVSLSSAHAAVADPAKTLEERLRSVVLVEDAVLIGIRTIAFVQHTQPAASMSAKNARLILERLVALTRG